MVCTFGDQTDVEWWQEFNLPMRQIVGNNGCLLPLQFSEFDGQVGDAENGGLQAGGEYGVPSLHPEKATEIYSKIQG
ncbi:MAG: hypothetical protein R6T96_13820, partial [Longimicrobiales bacterium]